MCIIGWGQREGIDLLEQLAKPSLHDVAHDCVLDTFWYIDA